VVGKAEHKVRDETTTPHLRSKVASSASKSGEPSPVTGSHPAVAGKPSVLQPGFEPWVMSVSARDAFAYSHGFRNPRGDLPAAMSRSLRSATTLAKIGVAQDVPSTGSFVPPLAIITFWPYAETSGYARPVLLKRPAFVPFSLVRYDATSRAW
jgi:hypothetical protein